jgi:preprotein translocase subunit SecE
MAGIIITLGVIALMVLIIAAVDQMITNDLEKL